MNLSPSWVPLFTSFGWEARHWSQLGPGNAPDETLLRWAREHDHVLVTQDLDFSHLLFATKDSGPSVAILRMENEFDEANRLRVCAALTSAQAALEQGALLAISERRVRVRRLPISPDAGAEPL